MGYLFPQSKWRQLGYRANLYSTDPIEVSDSGRALLVGREMELAKIHQHLVDGASVVALEGDYGVGKTSLAAVAAFEASEWRGHGGPLFLPAIRKLSLRPEDTRESFEKRAMRVVAGTILRSASVLMAEGRELPGSDAVNRWLNSPELVSRNGQVNVSILGNGGGAGYGESRSLNEGSGFDDSGLISLVDDWLASLFPDREAGGVILFLENLEELQDSRTALNVMEPLRDPLFKRPGLRWMITGAEGMVRAAYASPKMTGVFLNPIEVCPLADEAAPQVIQAREAELREDADAVTPVTAEAFADLYNIIGKNLRYSLNLAERYSADADVSALRDLSTSERDLLFRESMLSESKRVYDAYANNVTKADWKVFGTLIGEKAGSCSPSDYADFGYANPSPLIVRVRSLEQAQLVTYTVDDSDQRRRNISVTDHGRLAYYWKVHLSKG